ncbi:acyl-CoA dehydrogenase family protein [Nocardioides nitrophenolicus]|uniref:acyl-CoA dehydrogenase family protein n=1 Tax=Nocardioides nitrophenolicus TaxID=60489 RepID=UPI00195B4B66|nr:acyl-CoA dehydrogenase family protein [Nocardioides nitrophenolicus]MBM7519330.1 alkylation response protein AidB-like acyl-CoA dehydrogenase [Nocardioides nitrophenolicus]
MSATATAPLTTAEVLAGIDEVAPRLAELAPEAERLRRLPDESAALLRRTGLMRMLQPTAWGGAEAHPVDFIEATLANARSGCAAAGWVGGVVGLHPWELGVMSPQAQEDVWGQDQDTWIASPYVALGRARRVDGGFVLDGHWFFSSGSDHADWAHLGGLVVDEDGQPIPGSDHHFLVPKGDFEIVPDSWDTIGLRGSGSNDVVVRERFVPSHRVLEYATVVDGTAAAAVGKQDSPLYKMPWFVLFGNAISATVVGICEAALDATLAYQRDRSNVFGTRQSQDAFTLPSIGEAASDIRASRLQVIDNVRRVHEVLERGEVPTLAMRAEARRDQVRASWRAVAAVDQLFARAGGNSIRSDQALQRLWRDAHAGLNHAVNIPGGAYQAAALSQMGLDLEGAVL